MDFLIPRRVFRKSIHIPAYIYIRQTTESKDYDVYVYSTLYNLNHNHPLPLVVGININNKYRSTI